MRSTTCPPTRRRATRRGASSASGTGTCSPRTRASGGWASQRFRKRGHVPGKQLQELAENVVGAKDWYLRFKDRNKGVTEPTAQAWLKADNRVRSFFADQDGGMAAMVEKLYASPAARKPVGHPAQPRLLVQHAAVRVRHPLAGPPGDRGVHPHRVQGGLRHGAQRPRLHPEREGPVGQGHLPRGAAVKETLPLEATPLGFGAARTGERPHQLAVVAPAGRDGHVAGPPALRARQRQVVAGRPPAEGTQGDGREGPAAPRPARPHGRDAHRLAAGASAGRGTSRPPPPGARRC